LPAPSSTPCTSPSLPTAPTTRRPGRLAQAWQDLWRALGRASSRGRLGLALVLHQTALIGPTLRRVLAVRRLRPLMVAYFCLSLVRQGGCTPH
jgi:hypothetical protein